MWHFFTFSTSAQLGLKLKFTKRNGEIYDWNDSQRREVQRNGGTVSAKTSEVYCTENPVFWCGNLILTAGNYSGQQSKTCASYRDDGMIKLEVEQHEEIKTNEYGHKRYCDLCTKILHYQQRWQYWSSFKQCADYARRKLNLENDYQFMEYEDKGLSGYISDWPDYQRMLRDVQNGKIRAIVCYKLGRIGRKTTDMLHLMNFLEMYHADLLIGSNAINTASDFHKSSSSSLWSLRNLKEILWLNELPIIWWNWQRTDAGWAVIRLWDLPYRGFQQAAEKEKLQTDIIAQTENLREVDESIRCYL